MTHRTLSSVARCIHNHEDELSNKQHRPGDTSPGLPLDRGFLSGTAISRGGVDTTNILFVCGGAFTGLEKIISARGRSSSIGFGAQVIAPEDRGTGEIFREVAPEDLLKYGLIPEFVGRLPVLATLEDLDELALKRILREPKNALVKQYQRLFEMEGIDLTLAEEALGAIARKAIDRKTGARGLRSIMEGILLDTMFDLPSLEGVEEVVISGEVVEGTERPLYIYAARAGDAGASAS